MQFTRNGKQRRLTSWTVSAQLGSHSLSFDGGDFANAPDSATLSVTAGITLATWVKRVNPAARPREIYLGKGNGGGGGATAYWFDFQADERLGFYLANAGGGDQYLQTSASFVVNDTDWHQIVGTYNGASQKIYLDGVEVANANWASSIFDNAQNFAIGQLGSYAAERLEGQLDDVGLWNDPLTAGETLALFNLALEPTLQYDLGEADQLFELHNAGSGEVTIDGLPWHFETGLTGGVGVVQFDQGQYLLQLTAGGTGVATPAIPEPSTCLLLTLGALLVARTAVRNRRKRPS